MFQINSFTIPLPFLLTYSSIAISTPMLSPPPIPCPSIIKWINSMPSPSLPFLFIPVPPTWRPSVRHRLFLFLGPTTSPWTLHKSRIGLLSFRIILLPFCPMWPPFPFPIHLLIIPTCFYSPWTLLPPSCVYPLSKAFLLSLSLLFPITPFIPLQLSLVLLAFSSIRFILLFPIDTLISNPFLFSLLVCLSTLKMVLFLVLPCIVPVTTIPFTLRIKPPTITIILRSIWIWLCVPPLHTSYYTFKRTITSIQKTSTIVSTPLRMSYCINLHSLQSSLLPLWIIICVFLSSRRSILRLVLEIISPILQRIRPVAHLP